MKKIGDKNEIAVWFKTPTLVSKNLLNVTGQLWINGIPLLKSYSTFLLNEISVWLIEILSSSYELDDNYIKLNHKEIALLSYISHKDYCSDFNIIRYTKKIQESNFQNIHIVVYRIEWSFHFIWMNYAQETPYKIYHKEIDLKTLNNFFNTLTKEINSHTNGNH